MANGFDPHYSKNSPYFYTKIIGRYLYYYTHVPVLPHPLDVTAKIDNYRYVNRPDNLAYDLYGDPLLEWVIPIRNGLQDPIFDLSFGRTLIIPHVRYVRTLHQ